MNSYTAWRMNVVAYGVWVGLSLIAGMIIPGLVIYARSSELQVDYSSTETTSELPLWSMGEIIVKFENDITEDYRNMIIREYGCSVIGRCLFSNVQLVRIPESLTAAEAVDIFQKEEAVDYAENPEPTGSQTEPVILIVANQRRQRGSAPVESCSTNLGSWSKAGIPPPPFCVARSLASYAECPP